MLLLGSGEREGVQSPLHGEKQAADEMLEVLMY